MPEYKLFTEEPKPKRNRRHKKYAKEALEAKEVQKQVETKSGVSLEQQIMKRNSERAGAANNFFDRLMEKYGGADDSEDYVFPGSKSKTKKSAKKPAANGKTPEHRVKGGRVTKKK